jgi:hypothetical protein
MAGTYRKSTLKKGDGIQVVNAWIRGIGLQIAELLICNSSFEKQL